MNTRALIAAAALAAISIMAVASTRTVSSGAERQAQPVRTVSLGELAAKPLSHLGRVRVEGVVESADEDKGLFVLTTRKDPKRCGKECGTSCAGESTTCVPVRWSLKPGQAVVVEGTVQKDGKGAAFVADTVKKQ